MKKYPWNMGEGIQGGSLQARLDAVSAEAIADTLPALTAPSRLLILGQLRQELPPNVTELTEAIYHADQLPLGASDRATKSA
jgi:hypothetical protein